jgi:hypothetical protein
MRRAANAQFIGSLQATLPTRLHGDDDDDDKNVLYSNGRSGILKSAGYFVGDGCGLFVWADFEGDLYLRLPLPPLFPLIFFRSRDGEKWGVGGFGVERGHSSHPPP